MAAFEDLPCNEPAWPASSRGSRQHEKEIRDQEKLEIDRPDPAVAKRPARRTHDPTLRSMDER
jgi:hypothetical protein